MNRRLTRTAGCALAVAMLTLGACDDSYGDASTSGTESSSEAAADSLDPCGLVDQSAIEDALGTSLDAAGPAVPAAHGSQCTWTFVDDATGLDGSVSITTWHGSEFFSDLVGEPVSGLGDEARADPGLGVVLFRSGDEVVQVQTVPSSRVDAARNIADLALGQI